MKNSKLLLFNPMLLLIVSAFSSCSYTYEILNKDQVIKDVGYSSGKLPFRMATSDLQAPMFSKKGQVYADGNIGNSIGIGAGVAVTEKAFIIGRFSRFNSSRADAPGATYLEAHYEYSSYDFYTGWSSSGSGDTTGVFEYSKDHDLNAKSFEFGYGRFTNVKNNFRNEWVAGAGWGKTKNSYLLTMNTEGFNFLEQRSYRYVYLQDNFGWVSKHFEATAIGRINGYFFNDRTFKMDLWHEAPDYQRNAFSLEGGLRIAAGFRFLKGYMQVSGTIPVASPEIEWTPAQVKVGLIMKLGR